MAITVTSTAVNEIKKIMAAQNLGPETVLRLVIDGGGCSGMMYSLGFDTVYDPLTDARHENEGIALVTKKTFDLFMDGTEIDFIDSEYGKGFQIDNPTFPQGVGACAGCGGQ